MPSGAQLVAIEPLAPEDIVAVAQCIAIDGDAFPYASAHFGMRSGAGAVWVAREGGAPRVIGFVAGHARARVFHVVGLAVSRAGRRRGIGRALIRTAIADARARHLRRVALHVSVANHAAIALYRSEGFRLLGRLVGFYPPAAFNGEADAFAMALAIGETA